MKRLWWLMLLVSVLTAALAVTVACGDDDDDDDDDDDGGDDDDDDNDDATCEELYQGSVITECTSYSAFRFYGCSPEEEMTDPECYLACVAAIDPTADDSKYLCYDAEVCISGCSTDDASGCENMYYGMPNQACITYKEFFVQACDPRHELNLLSCAQFCYETYDESCDAFDECLLGCDG
jgi:hypothetical protein